MSAPPRSKEFDDVYFSAQDGLAETRYVFLEGNNLVNQWKNNKSDADRFVICETGFGTGLNFLAAWKLFEETQGTPKALEFISFEKYPLSAPQIEKYLEPWADEFKGYLPALIKAYPLRISGFHKVVLSDRVTLIMIFDDVNSAMPQLEAGVDAWFLDGFKPATNPQMWSQTVFDEMARLSNSGASFATFTATGDVRRGLQLAGFDVRKVSGFGHKREMLVGEFI